jgi:plasmid stability protein
MATLHVRSVPDELHNRLRELARNSQRSLSAQVITLLAEAVEDRGSSAHQTQLLAGIRRRRFHPPAGAPNSTELLRQDRER